MKIKDLKTEVSAILTTEKETKHKVIKKMQIFIHKSTSELQNTEMYVRPESEFVGGLRQELFH